MTLTSLPLTVSEFMTEVNYSLRGIDDDTPTEGNDEWIQWLSILNRFKNSLYQDPTKEWRFSFKLSAPIEPGTVATTGTTTLTGTGTYFTDYQVGDKITVSGETIRTIATITSDTSLTVTAAFSNTASAKTFTRDTIIQTGVESYNLHRRFIGASDEVYVLTTGSEKVYFKIQQPQERSRNTKNVYLSGANPEVLTFTTDVESTENIVGGSLIVPGYYNVADLTLGTDTMPFPDGGQWAVQAVAAEIAFGDITYEDRAPTLQDRANDLYKKLVRNNRRGTYNNPGSIPTNVYRIKDTRTT